MCNNKLIEDLIEILKYKERAEFKKKKYQAWLNDKLKCLWKLWQDKYGCFYSFLCNAEKDDLIWWELADKHFKEFEKKLKEIFDDYTKKEVEKDGK